MRKSNYLWLLLVAVLLLPAQEMAAKKKKEKEVTDRELWAGVLYQMAAPVLSNMSEGKLQENMQVELSPTWDGRDKRVTYMECFGRLMAGLAPWLSLPDDDTAYRTDFQKNTSHCKAEHCICPCRKSHCTFTWCNWCGKHVGSRICRCWCIRFGNFELNAGDEKSLT